MRILLFSGLLALDLVQEIEIPLIELVDTYVAILSSAGISSTLWVNGDRVQGPKVTFHTANLVFKDLMVETCLEFALT